MKCNKCQRDFMHCGCNHGVKPRIAYLEGPASERLKGWSHFLLCIGTRPPAAFMAHTEKAALRAVALNAEFFPRGTWEKDGHESPEVVPLGESAAFAPISDEITAWLRGEARVS